MPGEKKPLHPIGVVGLLFFILGLVAWLWLGEWRWAVSGLLALFVLAIVGAALDARAARR